MLVDFFVALISDVMSFSEKFTKSSERSCRSFLIVFLWPLEVVYETMRVKASLKRLAVSVADVTRSLSKQTAQLGGGLPLLCYNVFRLHAVQHTKENNTIKKMLWKRIFALKN